jgi:hypothetical protein
MLVDKGTRSLTASSSVVIVKEVWKPLGKAGERRRHMHVGVIHRISDPEGFEAAEQKALETGLPEGFALPVHAATPDHTTGICIWQGELVEAVKELVESVVGPYSANEYFELEVDGLPAG